MAALAMGCWAGVCAGAGPAQRGQEYVPAEWGKANVVWKGTWEETLAANGEEGWRKEVETDKGRVAAASQIVGLRKIELLKAMMQRFPDRKDKHAQAYREIAGAYGTLRATWWQRYWLWKLVQDFPLDREARAAAYQGILDPGPGAGPTMGEWEFVIDEVLKAAMAGEIAADHPAVTAACLKAVATIQVEGRYDRVGPLRAALEKLGGANPKVYFAWGALMESVGHGKLAAGAYGKAKDSRGEGLMIQVRRPTAGNPVGDAELEMAFDSIRAIGKRGAGTLTPAALQAVLDRAVKTGALARMDEMYCVGAWRMCDEAFGRLAEEPREALRGAQEVSARRLAKAAGRAGDVQELQRLFRRYPLAPSVHEAMLELAEESVRAGRGLWAAAACRDVLAHSRDEQTRAQGQALLWVAIAQGAEGGRELELEPAGAAGAQLPWRGGMAPAGQVRAELLGPLRQAQGGGAAGGSAEVREGEVVRLAAEWPGTGRRNNQAAELQTSTPWPVQWVEASAGGLLVGCGDSAAFYGPGGGKALWVQSRPEPATPRRQPWDSPAPGPFNWRTDCQPIGVTAAGEAAGTVVCLQDRYATELVAAFDAAGTPLWTTAARAEWKGLRPLSRPLVAEGRVYVLALAGQDGQALLQVHCMDARDGASLWVRTLGFPTDLAVDLAGSGAGLAIRQGALYCSSNAGLFARCDGRDGLVDWVRGYDGGLPASKTAIQFSREGGPPILAGRAVIAAPRDHTGLIAFDRDNGTILWESPMLPSDKLVGLAASGVIAMNRRYIACVDPGTGLQRWCRRLDEAAAPQATIVGDDILLTSAGRLLRLAATTGETLSQHPLAHPEAADHVFMPDGRLVPIALTEPPVAQAPIRPGPIRVPLALAPALSVPCFRPELALPAGGPGEYFCAVSGRQLIGIRLLPSPAVAWSRVLDRQPDKIQLHGRHVVAAFGPDVVAWNVADGSRAWSRRLPFAPHALAGDDRLVLAASGPGADPAAALLEPTSGKLLWCRWLDEGVRFELGKGVLLPVFRRQADGSAALGLVMTTLFAAEGWRPAEVLLDQASGAVTGVSPLPFVDGWPDNVLLAADWVFFRGSDQAACLARRGTGAPGPREWTHPFPRPYVGGDNNPFGPVPLPAGPAFRSMENLFLYDVASRREVAFAMPKVPWGLQTIQALAQQGDTVATVSVLRIAWMHRSLKYREVRKPAEWYLDLFDRASGKHLARQPLPGLSCWDTSVYQYTPSAAIVGPAVVATSAAAVHVFATPAP